MRRPRSTERGRAARAALPLPPGFAPDPRLGQCFVVNPDLLEREIGYAGIEPTDTVLEIGAGPGLLTERLARVAAEVRAIEVDERLRPHLEPLAARHPNVQLAWGDALSLAWPSFQRAVANLPYAVALPLVFRLLEHEFHTAVLVVQHRLARRLGARPGQPGYSRLSVSAQRLAGVRLLEVVPRREFAPAPRVDSAMIRLRRCRPRFAVADEEQFRRLLDQLFLRRDRSLAAALRAWAPPGLAAALPGDLAATPVERMPPEGFGVAARLVAEAQIEVPEVPAETKRTAQRHRRR